MYVASRPDQVFWHPEKWSTKHQGSQMVRSTDWIATYVCMYVCDVMCMYACVMHVRDTFQGAEFIPLSIAPCTGCNCFQQKQS